LSRSEITPPPLPFFSCFFPLQAVVGRLFKIAFVKLSPPRYSFGLSLKVSLALMWRLSFLTGKSFLLERREFAYFLVYLTHFQPLLKASWIFFPLVFFFSSRFFSPSPSPHQVLCARNRFHFLAARVPPTVPSCRLPFLGDLQIPVLQGCAVFASTPPSWPHPFCSPQR